jgi:hypothetical protein
MSKQTLQIINLLIESAASHLVLNLLLQVLKSIHYLRDIIFIPGCSGPCPIEYFIHVRDLAVDVVYSLLLVSELGVYDRHLMLNYFKSLH